MKKLSALLLTFIMVISLITIPVSATGTAVTFDALTDATNYFNHRLYLDFTGFLSLSSFIL